MNTKIEKLENNSVKLTIEVDTARFEEGMRYAYNKNKGNINIPGFRKGKVPRQMIETQYGPEIFYEDAINHVIPDAYEEAVKETKLDIVSKPEIDVEQVGKGKNLIFTAIVTIKPEVILGQYKEVEVEKTSVEVAEEEVEAELKKVQEKNARLITVSDRAIQDGDIVTIDYEGFVDGVAFEGGKGEDYDLTIGSHTFIDTFEEQLIGRNLADDLEVQVTFPEQYQSEELAGKPAVFKVEIKDIKINELPNLDDELAKDTSEFDTLDEYKADIKDKLLKQKEHTAKHEKERKVLEKVVARTAMEVPAVMIEQQMSQMLENAGMRMKNQGFQLEQFLQYTGQDMDSFKESFREEADFNVKARLVLEAVVKAENIVASDEEFEAELERMAQSYNMEADKLKAAVKDHEKEAMKQDIQVHKALEFIVEQAKEME